MIVAEGDRILFERAAADIPAEQPHAIMSISKTVITLVTGTLRERGLIDLQRSAGSYLPWLRPGYAGASLQDIADMNVSNAYDEDDRNPHAMSFRHDAATGMRLPPGAELTAKSFLATIGLASSTTDTRNPTRFCMYRSANTDAHAAVAEVAANRPMCNWQAGLADAAGVEGAVRAAGDRTGFPTMSGGLCPTLRDLARTALLIARGGGVSGQDFGSAAFLHETLGRGIPLPPPRSDLRYSNQFNTNGRWLGHGGYGGQYMLADMTTGRVAVYLSVLETEDGSLPGYDRSLIRMLAEICAGSARISLMPRIPTFPARASLLSGLHERNVRPFRSVPTPTQPRVSARSRSARRLPPFNYPLLTFGAGFGTPWPAFQESSHDPCSASDL